MCMQCVAQSAPFVGVAVTMLNRRNLKHFVTDTLRRTPAHADEDAPMAPAAGMEAATVPAGEPPSGPPQDAAERIPVGV
jgi:hypothetical protein